MKFDIFTLFPEFFAGPLTSSILKRGQAGGLLEFGVHNIRDWTTDKHHVCDDYPFGGGAGMVMKAEPVAAALEDVLKSMVGPAGDSSPATCPVIYLTPGGTPFSQSLARELSGHPRIALLCGHYEGLDERVVETLVTHEISIGDYVLTGGEAAAVVVIEAVARLVPGVLGNAESPLHESFSAGLLEAPQYTRPADWRGRGVPAVLTSGHHAEVEKWRRAEALRRTLQRRPDLAAGLRGLHQWTKDELEIWNEFERRAGLDATHEEGAT